MNILTTRFGLIQACETDVILIPEGLLGFRSFTHYVHIPDPVVHGLSWLQSLTSPDLAFGLAAPPLAVGDYRVELRPGDRTVLELEDERSAESCYTKSRRRGRVDGQPSRAAGFQSDSPARPATRLDLQQVSRAISPGASSPAPALTLLPGPSPLRATA